MDLMLNFEPTKSAKQISYQDKLLLIGSCFTEHIGNSLAELKFHVLQNPNGILFDPVSVSKSLVSYIQDKKYSGADVFQLNEIWQSWQHHSRFSHIDRDRCLQIINDSQQEAHSFLRDAGWLIITLGTAFSYRLSGRAPYFDQALNFGGEVANCHRAPSHWFNKHLLETGEIITAMDNCIQELFQFNPKLNIIFTISPVRHIRDGIVENNRSKARLIEAVQCLAETSGRIHYFPAYELVIDVLRDYRFYETDLVHPNNMATQFVFEKFVNAFADEETANLIEEIKAIVSARRHKSFQPATEAHKKFLRSYLEKVKIMKQQFTFLDLGEELDYFAGNSEIR